MRNVEYFLYLSTCFLKSQLRLWEPFYDSDTLAYDSFKLCIICLLLSIHGVRARYRSQVTKTSTWRTVCQITSLCVRYSRIWALLDLFLSNEKSKLDYDCFEMCYVSLLCSTCMQSFEKSHWKTSVRSWDKHPKLRKRALNATITSLVLARSDSFVRFTPN